MLNDEELVRIISIVKEENKKGLPIVAGVIRNSTAAAIEAGIAAKKAGADVLMVTPTSYNVLVPSEDGNYAYYQTISDYVDLPIVIYNVVPQNYISTALFNRLLDIKNVIGIKEACGGIHAMYEKILACGDRGNIYAATDDMLYSCFDLGADGTIAAILTVFPDISVEIWNCVRKGDRETAKKLQDSIYPLWQEITGNHFPSKIKEALKQLGRDVGLPRSPILEATRNEKENIHKAIAKMKKDI
jgi:4-hydroxy-tetrahydrodipicolinate synthase